MAPQTATAKVDWTTVQRRLSERNDTNMNANVPAKTLAEAKEKMSLENNSFAPLEDAPDPTRSATEMNEHEMATQGTPMDEHRKSALLANVQKNGKMHSKLNSGESTTDLSHPPKRGKNFETPKLNFDKRTPAPLINTLRHEFRVRLVLKADEQKPFVDPCALLRVFISVAQKYDPDLCLYPYNDDDTRNPLQCPEAVPNDIEETKAYLSEQTPKGKSIIGFAKIVSKLTFGQLKNRICGWLHHFDHYMSFIGIKSSNPVQVAFLANSHPQNTNHHYLSAWLRQELNLNQEPLTEFHVFPSKFTQRSLTTTTTSHVITIQLARKDEHIAWKQFSKIFTESKNRPSMYCNYQLCPSRPRDRITHDDIQDALEAQNHLLHSVTLLKTKFFRNIDLLIKPSNFLQEAEDMETDLEGSNLRKNEAAIPENWEEEDDEKLQDTSDSEDPLDDEYNAFPFKHWLMTHKNENNEYLFHAIDNMGLG